MSEEADLTKQLSSSCREALEHLRERRPKAQTVAIHGDWAFISVGYIGVASVTAAFEQEEALGLVRIPTYFPCNTRPYGIITVPFLERSDRQAVRKQERNHNHARPVEQALGVDDTGFWSWRWDDVSSNDESDLRKAPDMIRERLQMED